MDSHGQRRLAVGAEATADGAHFRVWAPRRKRVDVVLEPRSAGRGARRTVALTHEAGGYFSAHVPDAGDGTLYRYRLDGDDGAVFPDPASRFQPEGPHGPSRVVDPARFAWTDRAWKGVASTRGQVIYELHVGTFTREGTWAAAARELPELARLGITIVEVMPIADFPGAFGWGYDGVDLFAPTRLYGEPDDFRRFVDAAHAAGVAVILDVVYNHVGPDGNYLTQFSQSYFSKRYKTDWGEPINFDGTDSAPVREFYLANARYWIDEFHLDGLRLDATQSIFDDGAHGEHIFTALGRTVHEAARGRGTYIVSENEPQETRLVRPVERGGYGLDALWNDDFHHSARVAVTGRSEAYFTDYPGTPQEFISAVKYGYLYQGQYYKWQKNRRGTPGLDLPPTAFVLYIQNHDQVANSARGARLSELTSPGRLRAITALMLLAPGTPMLFQGQEFAASSPFLYFADHNPELAQLVKDGRREFLKQFPSIATPSVLDAVAPPHERATFERCKLDFAERESHAGIYALHKDLLALRRGDPVFAAQRKGAVDGAVLGDEAFVLRYFGETPGDDRLLVVNFGKQLSCNPAPEPLLAPPVGARRWKTLWSSEDPTYGGLGTPPLDTESLNWCIPAGSAVAMAPDETPAEASAGDAAEEPNE